MDKPLCVKIESRQVVEIHPEVKAGQEVSVSGQEVNMCWTGIKRVDRK